MHLGHRNFLFIFFLFLSAPWVQAQDTLTISLEDALEIALTENPVVLIAGKEVERQHYFLREARGNLIPVVTGSGTFNRSLKDAPMFMSGSMVEIFMGDNFQGEIPAVIARRMSGTTNSYNASVQISAPLFSMGLYRNIELSETNIKMALESARQSALSLKNQVEKAFYGWLLAEKALDVMQKSLANAERNLSDARVRFEQGLAAEFDLIRSEVQVSNIKPSVAQAEHNLSLAGWQLKMLLGLDLNTPVKLAGDLALLESDLTRYVPKPINVVNNPDLATLQIQSEQLEVQQKLVRASRMPTLFAVGSYSMISQNSDFRFRHYQWLDSPTVGLSLNVPIFNGFTKKYKEKQLLVARDQLDIQKDYRLQGVLVEVRQAMIRMQQAVDQLQSNKDGVRQAEKAYAIAQTRYHNGIGTMLELNDADVALTQSQLNYHQSIYEFVVARSDYDLINGEEPQ